MIPIAIEIETGPVVSVRKTVFPNVCRVGDLIEKDKFLKSCSEKKGWGTEIECIRYRNKLKDLADKKVASVLYLRWCGYCRDRGILYEADLYYLDDYCNEYWANILYRYEVPGSLLKLTKYIDKEKLFEESENAVLELIRAFVRMFYDGLFYRPIIFPLLVKAYGRYEKIIMYLEKINL